MKSEDWYRMTFKVRTDNVYTKYMHFVYDIFVCSSKLSVHQVEILFLRVDDLTLYIYMMHTVTGVKKWAILLLYHSISSFMATKPSQ